MLPAICHFVRITLFIASTPPESLTEHVFSYGDKMKTATAKVGVITQNIDRINILHSLFLAVLRDS